MVVLNWMVKETMKIVWKGMKGRDGFCIAIQDNPHYARVAKDF